jgi:hypothetical protein
MTGPASSVATYTTHAHTTGTDTDTDTDGETVAETYLYAHP